MKIQEAIMKALDGGYGNDGVTLEQMLLDPQFWKCLSKAMGYDEEWRYLYFWRHLIDHLAEGGSIESYFELL